MAKAQLVLWGVARSAANLTKQRHAYASIWLYLRQNLQLCVLLTNKDWSLSKSLRAAS